MLKKNDVITVQITDNGSGGEGIAKHNGYTLFVKNGVKGDTAEIKILKINKSYGFAKIEKIITPSENRQNPPCPYFEKCGGCNIMHLKYSAQLALKEEIVKNNLYKTGGFSEGDFIFENIIPSADFLGYRNKAQFPVAEVNNRIVCGFFAERSHSIVPLENCLIQSKKINQIMNICTDFFTQNKISAYSEKTKNGIVRNVYIRDLSDGVMVVIVANSNRKIKNIDALVKVLAENGVSSVIQNVNTKDTNVIMGEKNIILYGKDEIGAKIGDIKYLISSKSFFQVNTKQTEILYKKALEYANPTKNDTVFDLFCGCGTISLFMAESAKKVIGVEIVEDAVKSAEKNAHFNKIKNAFFYSGDCDKVVKNLIENGETADIIVVDPPRKGLTGELVNMICSLNPKRIIYVSCNSATLARDVALAKNYGYILTKAAPVDMFPNTAHVETVVLLSRKIPDDRIEIDIDLDELDITTAESKATYEEIKEYVLNKYHFKVSSLYIAQIKTKYGIKEAINYNISKKGTRVPLCPPDKENAITDALKYYGMI